MLPATVGVLKGVRIPAEYSRLTLERHRTHLRADISVLAGPDQRGLDEGDRPSVWLSAPLWSLGVRLEGGELVMEGLGSHEPVG
jgi:hypothetical protein